MRSFIFLLGLIFLTTISFELNAGNVELSSTITEGCIVQKASEPIHTLDTIHYRVTAINTGTVCSTIPVDVTFPNSFGNSSGSGTDFICSTTNRINVHCVINPPVCPNVPKTVCITTQAPANIIGSSQNFSIIAKIDPFNTVAEANETDNESRVFTTIVTRGPDYTVYLDQSDKTAVAGEEVRFVVWVENIGDGSDSRIPVLQATFPSTVQFLRTENLQSVGGCQNVGSTIQCPLSTALAPKASAYATFVGRVSATVSNGSVATFDAKIDPQNLVSESSETNNHFSFDTTLSGGVDLLVSSKSYSSLPCDIETCSKFGTIPSPGNFLHAVFIKAEVKNSGHISSAATKLRVTAVDNIGFPSCGSHVQASNCVAVVSSPCTNTSGDTAICDIGPLSPGNVQSIMVSGISTGGTGSVKFEIDPDKNVAESNESNNTATLTLQ